jgi:hypothetical protein
MNRRRTQSSRWLLTGLGALALCLGACSRSNPPEPVALADVPRILRETLREGPSSARTLAADVAAAVEAKAWPKASVGIEALVAEAGLTQKQAAQVARCVIAINSQLNTAAGAGDQEASEIQTMRRQEK